MHSSLLAKSSVDPARASLSEIWREVQNILGIAEDPRWFCVVSIMDNFIIRAKHDLGEEEDITVGAAQPGWTGGCECRTTFTSQGGSCDV